MTVAWRIGVLSLLMAFVTGPIEGCTPTQDRPLSENVAQTPVVLLGNVRRTYSDPTVDVNAYTAELNMFCVLKAPRYLRINAIHNVSEAGRVGGRCFAANLLVSRDYIVLAYMDNGKLKPMDSPVEATPQTIADISKVCRLSPRLPTGLQSSQRCQTNVDQDGCLVDHDHAHHHDQAHDHDHDHGTPDHDLRDHDHDIHGHDAHDHDHEHEQEHAHTAPDHSLQDHDHDRDGHDSHDHDSAHDHGTPDHDALSHDHDKDGHDAHDHDHDHDHDHSDSSAIHSSANVMMLTLLASVFPVIFKGL